ncbi:1-aminocyclopropane-1-carboxylate deaminase/D-cysteine desulfhydrase [Actinomadura sp. NEAU-AAG7]|uniref:1-aminocyclopropane-1-carboxylate deaminase/D-cysteine desulfhydrase n=1 Tax=Actinomadura sp. NEAU-AAG7 TaxID=2839640 RepID=UPI001BE4540A|nr:pyridoxal-phosphate dependent enzyme [Actinomadura sp. NEAU-AAG7]MBT2213108.1 pyridoxal-phosphate dependent enzyme [Actinomadura sp. NEAU-AAG7]
MTPPGAAPSPVVELEDDRIAAHGVRLFLKRDDLVHPDLPGNKWRKLRHNIAPARERGTLLTFGGAYSNHIRAAAAAGRLYGFATIGVIRGEEHLPLNDSLAYAQGTGMRLDYLDRAAYRRKHEPDVVAMLRERWGDFYLLPEGGSNARAVRGCAELGAELRGFDVVCCPCGTGGTLAGLAAGLAPGQRALGFAVLRGGFMDGEVERLQREAYGTRRGAWSVEHGFHFGGYARRTAALDAFADGFADRHGLVLERVYVAKMMAGIYALAARGRFPRGTRVAAVVTGPAGASDTGLSGPSGTVAPGKRASLP